MGDKIPEYELGFDCTNCWGEDKPFGEGSTPKHVQASVAGLAGIGEGGNGDVRLTQDPVHPCIWISDGGIFVHYVHFGPAITIFQVTKKGVAVVYERYEGMCATDSEFGDASIKLT